MTHKEFTIWLQGYLTDKVGLDANGIATIKDKMNEIREEVKLYEPPYMIPKTDPYKLPFNPTCETGKQSLNDNFTSK